MLKIEERALIVRPRIGLWRATKTDKEVTSSTLMRYKAKGKAGNFRKRLIDCESYKLICQIERKARNANDMMTLPWADDGDRIILTDSYNHYAKQMKRFRKEYERAVESFLAEYETIVKREKDNLGEMFKPEDYPPKEELVNKFYFDIEVNQVPTAGDFRVKISNKDQVAIVKDIERRTKMRVQQAMNDVWKRVMQVTQKMAEKLGNYHRGFGVGTESVFRDTLVENVRDLADVLPSLNITSDPKLDKIHKEIVKSLCAHDAEDLRLDDNLRKKTAKKAEAIHKKVSEFLA